MSVLYGHGSVGGGGGTGTGPVLATAALLGDTEGRFTLSDSLLSLVARRMRRGDGPLDTVLVARDASYALLLRLPPEFHLVGVVAEREMGFVPPAEGVAIVSGVAGVLGSIQDGDWVIVDPARGRVVVSPAAEEIARFQAGRRLRPSVLLGAAHTPARTLSGRTVAVWARAEAITDINAALVNGADGILIPEDSELLSETAAGADKNEAAEEEDPDEMMFALLRQAADAMGGGEVCIAAGIEAVHPRTIVRLAARCRLSWALRPEALPYPAPDILAEMNGLVDQEEDNGGMAALPRLSAYLSGVPAGGGKDETALIDFAEALWAEGAPLPRSLGFLPPIVRVLLPDTDFHDVIEAAVALGAVGVVAPPSRVEAVKDAIRQIED